MSGPPIERPPSRGVLIRFLASLALVMASLVGRWHDSIPAEVREEILTKLYQPTIAMLVRCGYRIDPIP